MHVIDKIWEIKKNKIKFINHNEHKIWSRKPLWEKIQLEGEATLLCLSLNGNG